MHSFQTRAIRPLLRCALVILACLAGMTLVGASPLGAQTVERGNASGTQLTRKERCAVSLLGMGVQYQFSGSKISELSVDPTAYPTVGDICPGSAAEKAGLAVGDVVLEVSGKDFRKGGGHLFRGEPGEALVLRIRRDGVEREIILKVPPKPSPTP